LSRVNLRHMIVYIVPASSHSWVFVAHQEITIIIIIIITIIIIIIITNIII